MCWSVVGLVCVARSIDSSPADLPKCTCTPRITTAQNSHLAKIIRFRAQFIPKRCAITCTLRVLSPPSSGEGGFRSTSDRVYRSI